MSHLLTVFIVLVSPWLGRLQYRRAQKRLQAGGTGVRLKLYRSSVVEQIVVTAVVCGLWRWCEIPGPLLGICAPHSWWWTTGLAISIGGFLVQAGLRARPKAPKLRLKLQDNVGALLPGSIEEQRWFAAVSIGAGISEELVCLDFSFITSACISSTYTVWR
ncbi:MAG TPA: hypothetical protein VMT67_13365 [Terriglobales bacterium]|nr:hypothetical protein [Terriglobales bacterium]